MKEDGSIVAWGYNEYSQCDIPEPNTGFVAIAAGWYHDLGLKGNSSIAAWGDNSSGQCTVPSPNTGFVAVAGGELHSLGLYDSELSVEDEATVLINGLFSITAIYPNPFNSTASVLFQSPGTEDLKLEVFDTTGRLVGFQEIEAMGEGPHIAVWDGSGSGDETLGNGVYLIRIAGETGSSATARVVFLK